MARPRRTQRLRARGAELFEASHCRPHQHLDLVGHPSRLVRSILAAAQPPGCLRLARLDLHARGFGWPPAHRVSLSATNNLEQGSDGPHQYALLVPTPARVVFAQEECPLVRTS